MRNPFKKQIVEFEERLRLAMLQSDVNALDELLAPELIFTNHLGQRLTKKDDLAAHQSGTLEIEVLEPSEQHIQMIGDNVAIVSARVHLSGSYAGARSEADFRFTRIWVLSSAGAWRVVAAHSSIVT